jgi:hypothetical protein
MRATVIATTLALVLAPGLTHAGQHKPTPAKGPAIVNVKPIVDRLVASQPTDIVIPPQGGGGPQAVPIPPR